TALPSSRVSSSDAVAVARRQSSPEDGATRYQDERRQTRVSLLSALSPSAQTNLMPKLRLLQWLRGLDVSTSRRQRLLKVAHLSRTCASRGAKTRHHSAAVRD